MAGLSHKRGPLPARNPLQDEIDRLTHENLRLAEDLRKASIMIDFPKKVATLWDLPTPAPQTGNRL